VKPTYLVEEEYLAKGLEVWLDLKSTIVVVCIKPGVIFKLEAMIMAAPEWSLLIDDLSGELKSIIAHLLC
jgi:hypothetical protein